MFTLLEWVERGDPRVTPFHNKPEWVVTPAARAAVGPDGRRAHDKPSCCGKRTWLMESCISAGLWLCGEMGERNAGRTAIYQGERQRRASHQRRLSTAAAVSGGINAESSLLRGELLISDTTTAPGYLSFLCFLLTLATAGDVVFMNCPFKRWENCLGGGGGDNQILIMGKWFECSGYSYHKTLKLSISGTRTVILLSFKKWCWNFWTIRIVWVNNKIRPELQKFFTNYMQTR